MCLQTSQHLWVCACGCCVWVLHVHAGAAPFFMSERAMEKLQSRKSKPATFNLDMNLIGDYWGWYGKRSYHHTGPVSTFYASESQRRQLPGSGCHACRALRVQLCVLSCPVEGRGGDPAICKARHGQGWLSVGCVAIGVCVTCCVPCACPLQCVRLLRLCLRRALRACGPATWLHTTSCGRGSAAWASSHSWRMSRTGERGVWGVEFLGIGGSVLYGAAWCQAGSVSP